MIESFALARPMVLFALLLVPLYAAWRWRSLGRAGVPYAPLQYRNAGRKGGGFFIVGAEALVLTIVLAAIAGPHQLSELELIDDPGIDILLVLDVSLSMLAEDFEPNRLAGLQRTVRDFLRRSGSHRIGMVIFAKDTYVQCPLTTDRLVLTELLESATVYTMNNSKSGGTAVGDAVLVGVEQLKKARLPGRDQAMILITDGESNAGIDPVLAGRYARQEEVRFYAIGIGGEEPIGVMFEGRPVGVDSVYQAYLDDTELKNVTAAAEGRYFRVTDDQVLDQVFADLSRLESAPLEVRTVRQRTVHVRWIALAALLCFTVWLILAGLVWRRPLL